MARACHVPVRLATGEAFSDEEIDDILERLADRFKARTKSAPASSTKATMAAAAAELTRSELKRLLFERRLATVAKAVRARREAQIDGMGAGLNEAERLRAFSVGSEKQGFGTNLSTSSQGRAHSADLWSALVRGLDKKSDLFRRLSNPWGKGLKDLERQVAREMARLTGDDTVAASDDPDVRRAAETMTGVLERARQMQNTAGAFIERLPGYIARQQHDRLRIAGGFWREIEAQIARVKAGEGPTVDWNALQLSAARKGFRQWRDFIRPRLDARTYEGIDADDVDLKSDAAALHSAGVIDDPHDIRERFLYRVWSDIVGGKREVAAGASDHGDFVPPASKARAMSQARVLHFSSPDAWLDYHQRYGKGSLLSAVMGQLDRAGRNTALLETWGPHPELAFKEEQARLIEQAKGRGAAGVMAQLQNYMRQAEFDQVTGANNVADHVRLAVIGKAIRVDQSLAKLGGVVLSQLGTDEAVAAQSFKRVGATWLDGYRHVWTGIARLNGADALRAADLCDVMAHTSAQHLMGSFMDGPLGWGSWMSQQLMRVTGSEALATGHRIGVAAGLAAHFGEQAAHDFGHLEIGARETLERFGLDAKAWDLIRGGAYKAGDGRRYLTFDALDHLADKDLWNYAGYSGKAKTAEAAARIKDGLRLRLQTMIGNTIEDTMLHARDREQVGLTRGTKPGTPLGEALRIATQFWGFHSSIMGRHIAPSARGFAGVSPVSLISHLILATTLGGLFSLEAKQMASGRTPRPLTDENGNFDPRIWIASMLQGGGLGIYGDYLFGEANRNGQQFGVEQLTGPGVSELESLAQLVHQATTGSTEDLAANTLRFGERNTPFVNTWYARIALDYLILNRLNEAVSPGYLARHEQKLEQFQHTQSLLAPGSAL